MRIHKYCSLETILRYWKSIDVVDTIIVPNPCNSSLFYFLELEGIIKLHIDTEGFDFTTLPKDTNIICKDREVYQLVTTLILRLKNYRDNDFNVYNIDTHNNLPDTNCIKGYRKEGGLGYEYVNKPSFIHTISMNNVKVILTVYSGNKQNLLLDNASPKGITQ